MDNRKTRILVVDDEEIVRESMAGWLEKDGYTVATAPDGPTAVERLRAEPWSILLVDLKMPGMDGLGVLEEARKLRPDAVVVIMTAYATVDTAVTAMKMGAFDYLVKPFDPEELSLLTQKIVAQQALARENILLRKVLKREYRFRDLLSNSPKMHAVFDLARVAARSHSTILVQGESGTGKELLARGLHLESPRSPGPVRAGAGAASRRKGKFEAAHGGTLFLDEIGDVSPKLQLDLLRVLEERRFSRVGGTESIQVDVRIIAATNRDLKKALEDGRFREDLYYRLNVIPITLPPLRQRREDLPLLVEHFLEHLGVELGRKLEAVSAEGMRLLTAHDWPGNVRELRNVLERAAVVASGPILDVADPGLLEGHPEQRQGSEGLASLEEVERRHIAEVLRRTGGNVSHAARILGIDRVTLYSKIKRYELRKEPESGT